ncbi:MAG TPA: DUF4410 domain-containing protein [Chthoniobacterales bacterium]|nr:DUF4410 domain-containing protein [Chthoniobacterales bacterium]
MRSIGLSNTLPKTNIASMRNGMLAFLAFLVAAFALPSRTSAGSNATTATGTYRDWNGDIDEVTIVQPFRAVGYTNISVESFDTSGVSLPNPKDNTYEAVQSALRLIKPAFIDGLVKKLRRRTGATVGGNTLVIRARLTKVDPGSQAARYWGGFGAGAVKIAIIGEIIDGRTEKTLVRFTQERRSGFGMFGGGYGELFTRTARQIGGDVATLINAF